MTDDSDTAFKAMREIMRPIPDDPWLPNAEPCDEGRQADVDDNVERLGPLIARLAKEHKENEMQRKTDDRHINQSISDMFKPLDKAIANLKAIAEDGK